MKNFRKARRVSLVLRAQLMLFKTCMMSCKRLIKILKCNLMLFEQARQSLQAHLKLPKHLLAMVVKDAIMLILMCFVLKANTPMLSKFFVESCDEAVRKENDNLKLEVKWLEQKVIMLKKQAKAQPSQDNRRNMVNKLEKGRIAPKLALQHQMKPTHHKEEEMANIDEKIEYARSVFLNARRLHIKNGIGYKSGDKHNLRVNSNGKVFIKFTKGNPHKEKKQSLNNSNHVSNANASYVSHMSYHDFDASYVLMRKKLKEL
jgi:hypothetical protein